MLQDSGRCIGGRIEASENAIHGRSLRILAELTVSSQWYTTKSLHWLQDQVAVPEGFLPADESRGMSFAVVGHGRLDYATNF